MESYLIDEKLLGQFADVLISQKYPGEPLEAHADIRNDIITALDNRISRYIIGSLTEEQGAELNQLLDGSASETAFEDFFKKHNIDLEEVIKKAIESFKDEFLKGGENA